MIRLFAAAAMTALVAAPAWAQNVSPGDSAGSSMQNQQQGESPGMSSPSMRSQGQAGQLPADCTPNDPRPECQTAQLPGQESSPSGSMSGQEQGGAGIMTPPAREPDSGSSSQGGAPSAPGSSGSGSMGR